MNILKMHPTKEKIVDTAIDLFSRSGFSAVSIRDITQTVGIKESSLYYHFKNKDQLLHFILDLFQAEIKKVRPPIEALDPILQVRPPHVFLKQGLDKYKYYICDNERMSKISRIISIEQFAQPRARSILLDELVEQNLKFLEIVFSKYIELGVIHPFPVRLLAAEYQYPILSMITQYQLLRFDGHDTSSLEQQMEEHITFFLHKTAKGDVV